MHVALCCFFLLLPLVAAKNTTACLHEAVHIAVITALTASILMMAIMMLILACCCLKIVRLQQKVKDLSGTTSSRASNETNNESSVKSESASKTSKQTKRSPIKSPTMKDPKQKTVKEPGVVYSGDGSDHYYDHIGQKVTAKALDKEAKSQYNFYEAIQTKSQCRSTTQKICSAWNKKETGPKPDVFDDQLTIPDDHLIDSKAEDMFERPDLTSNATSISGDSQVPTPDGKVVPTPKLTSEKLPTAKTQLSDKQQSQKTVESKSTKSVDVKSNDSQFLQPGPSAGKKHALRHDNSYFL